jgi:hypothetical protein
MVRVGARDRAGARAPVMGRVSVRVSGQGYDQDRDQSYDKGELRLE